MEVDENIKWVKIDENGLKYIKSVEINDKRLGVQKGENG